MCSSCGSYPIPETVVDEKHLNNIVVDIYERYISRYKKYSDELLSSFLVWYYSVNPAPYEFRKSIWDEVSALIKNKLNAQLFK